MKRLWIAVVLIAFEFYIALNNHKIGLLPAWAGYGLLFKSLDTDNALIGSRLSMMRQPIRGLMALTAVLWVFDLIPLQLSMLTWLAELGALLIFHAIAVTLAERYRPGADRVMFSFWALAALTVLQLVGRVMLAAGMWLQGFLFTFLPDGLVGMMFTMAAGVLGVLGLLTLLAQICYTIFVFLAVRES